MPSIISFSARFFGIDKSHSTTSCTCGCHQSISASNTFTPSRWFPRIRRRSSSASEETRSRSRSQAQAQTQMQTQYTVAEQEQLSRLYTEFKEYHTLAEDEMGYAVESRGSIYYRGDLLAAQEAVEICLGHYQQLTSLLDSVTSAQLNARWSKSLSHLRTRLDGLPMA
ncbi:hypothetical protein J3Q64DRAFT_1776020 [Phycomyces blakesleeanus]|uniref:Uncharacterized protein n=2 Tax=Phycomyces blakesleeanus TaxID=4837 RepID=A0A167M9T5_PHYB8|nr:hypothetical protein PHYBLDRAFT_80014 [Phycomyces blakesleeanus NRRL 1555(-)]OAD72224.1 hypothetical protein PHYBLDRAFT_80014 [Phycomyces blakesleeanus NRRL 1555(-)]|eukprot:XP_018290264.1 hypothetical protein PHYBLDRAFT_80014 [Phycomyces blakesleeanus NRRL 1555(-)]